MGTAGCIRHAAGDGTDELLIVFPANIACPPEIDVLVNEHARGRSDLTVMLESEPRKQHACGAGVGGIHLQFGHPAVHPEGRILRL